MEPVLGVDLSFFPPYGNTCLGRHSRLSGSFGNASLDGVTDFYSQLIYKVPLLWYYCWFVVHVQHSEHTHLSLSIRTTLLTPPHLQPHCLPHHHQLPGKNWWMASPQQMNWVGRMVSLGCLEPQCYTVMSLHLLVCACVCVVLLICNCLFARAWVCVASGVVPFNLQNLMSYLNERYDTKRGGSCSVESPQQDCWCPCLLANATPQQPGRAQVKT